MVFKIPKNSGSQLKVIGLIVDNVFTIFINIHNNTDQITQ